MQKIILEKHEYELIKDYKNAFDKEKLETKYTDYFETYDYILGDFAYDKLRLKGFYDPDNKKCSKINSLDTLDDYIKNYCAYDCRYFLLKKVK